jgi:hypothetical protein
LDLINSFKMQRLHFMDWLVECHLWVTPHAMLVWSMPYTIYLKYCSTKISIFLKILSRLPLLYRNLTKLATQFMRNFIYFRYNIISRYCDFYQLWRVISKFTDFTTYDQYVSLLGRIAGSAINDLWINLACITDS